MGQPLKNTLKTSGEVEYIKKDYGVIRGFNRLDPDHMGVPSYTVGTRTFALTPDHTYFEFFANGIKYTKSSAESVVWDITTGRYYFYFDVDGVLQSVAASGMTGAIFDTCAICGLVYWNATSGEAIIQASDEQHGAVNMGGIDPREHFRVHLSIGAVHLQGGNITGLVDGSDVYTSIATVVSADEDITHVNTTITTTPFMYRLGVGGDWYETATPNLKIGHVNSGDSDICWNQNNGGTWELTESASSTDYVIYYFLWTNDVNNPIKKVIGHYAYASRNDARDALQSEIGKLHLDGFPSTEAYLMYAYIVKRNGDLEDDGEGNTYVDLRRKFIFNA